MSCKHWGKCKLVKMRQFLNSNHAFSLCQQCNELPKGKKNKKKQDIKKGKICKDPCLCLECFGIFCNDHIVYHQNSQNHSMKIQILNLHIYCAKCDEYFLDCIDKEEDQIQSEKMMEFQNELMFVIKKYRKKDKNLSFEQNEEIEEVDDYEETQVEEELKEVQINNKVKVKVQGNKTGKKSGLANLGNTCYFNSIIQSLYVTKPLFQRYVEELAEKKLPPMNNTFKEVLIALSAQKATVNPQNLLKSIRKFCSLFNGHGQQDAHELLRFMLDGLSTEAHKAAKIQNSKSIIEKCFQGYLCSTITCQNCSHISRTFDPFLDISLEIPVNTNKKTKQHKNQIQPNIELIQERILIDDENVPDVVEGEKLWYPPEIPIKEHDTLFGCLNKFTNTEWIMDKFVCEKCEVKKSCLRRFTLYQIPFILTLHLKRFKTSGYVSNKNTKRISFPSELDCNAFCILKQLDGIQDFKYRLYAVVCHSGSMSFGHYIAYTRDDGVWYHCSDSRVTVVNDKNVYMAEAYILFYERITSNSQSQ